MNCEIWIGVAHNFMKKVILDETCVCSENNMLFPLQLFCSIKFILRSFSDVSTNFILLHLCYTLLQPDTLFYTLLHPTTPCYTLLHPATTCYTLLRPATPCYTLLHYATPPLHPATYSQLYAFSNHRQNGYGTILGSERVARVWLLKKLLEFVLRFVAVYCGILFYIALCCCILRHSALYCGKLLYIEVFFFLLL